MSSRLVIFIIIIIISIAGIFGFYSISGNSGITLPGVTKSLSDGSTKEFRLNNFSKIDFKTSGTLHIIKGDTNKLLIEANKDYIDRLQPVQVADTITFEQSNLSLKFWQKMDDVHYTLTYNTQINEIISRGSGVIVGDNLASDNLIISTLGAGDITLHDAKIDTSINQIKGLGNIKIDGECAHQSAVIESSGNIMTPRFKCAQGSVIIKGSGSSRVNIANSLAVKITGSGNIYYIGNPKLTSDIHGSGTVNQVEE